jgi:hypothetical protein
VIANNAERLKIPKEGSPLPISDTRPRIRFPSDLPGSLKRLVDAELRKLRAAVNGEIERRGQASPKKQSGQPDRLEREAAQIPEGKANLIRASSKAGLKPAAIARTLRISLAVVRRVLQDIR